MLRFGESFKTLNDVNRRLVYLNNRAIGVMDLINGEYHCFYAAEKAKAVVDSIADAKQWFEGFIGQYLQVYEDGEWLDWFDDESSKDINDYTLDDLRQLQ